jgi:hypothetical protein
MRYICQDNNKIEKGKINQKKKRGCEHKKHALLEGVEREGFESGWL